MTTNVRKKMIRCEDVKISFSYAKIRASLRIYTQ